MTRIRLKKEAREAQWKRPALNSTGAAAPRHEPFLIPYVLGAEVALPAKEERVAIAGAGSGSRKLPRTRTAPGSRAPRPHTAAPRPRTAQEFGLAGYKGFLTD